MCEVCGKIFFTLLTLLSIGITSAAVIGVFVLVQLSAMATISQEFNIGLYIALSFSVIMLIFAIYASCCGDKCARITLGILYLIYAAALGTAAGFILAKGSAIMNELGKSWTNPSDGGTLARELEKQYECLCWDSSQASCLNESITPSSPTCSEKIDKSVKNLFQPAGIVLAILAALMLAGMVLAFFFAFRHPDEDAEGWGITDA
jgi:hypothetical protein